MQGSDAFILKGKRAWKATTSVAAEVFRPDVMFDRIINVKINYSRYNTLADGTKQYYLKSFIIIRSDYELVANKAFNASNNSLGPEYRAVNGVTEGRWSSPALHYEKVRIKPDIRITYTGYGNLSINFEVNIKNFFTLMGDGNIAAELNGATEGIEITSLELLFGYMSQFPDVRKYPVGTAAKVYNDFTNRAYSNASYLCGDVLYWYRSSEPPDAAYTFYCCVASVSVNSLSQYAKLANKDLSLSSWQESIKLNYQYYIRSKPQTLVTLLDWYITRHYLRPNTKNLLNDPLIFNDAALSLTDKGSILYGVQVYCMSYKIFKQVYVDLAEAFIPLEANVVKMLNAIKQAYYPKLEFRFDVDGNVYIYDTSEDLDSFENRTMSEEVYAAAVAKMTQFEKALTVSGLNLRVSRPNGAYEPLVIPAVYSLQYGPLTEITCPYFSTLFPGQKLVYNASYAVAINQVASIDTAAPALETYTLLYYDIDFSTVSEYNNMNIYCIRSGM